LLLLLWIHQSLHQNSNSSQVPSKEVHRCPHKKKTMDTFVCHRLANLMHASVLFVHFST
jgi:hypothetical protein